MPKRTKAFSSLPKSGLHLEHKRPLMSPSKVRVIGG
jgi:hypothetical protein